MNIKIIECCICGNEFKSYGKTCNEKEQVCLNAFPLVGVTCIKRKRHSK